MVTKKIAVVTGANRGIGFEVSRQLAKKDIHVVLTSRNKTKGLVAYSKLKEEEFDVAYHQLDVTDISSIQALNESLKRDYGRLDILINNAGIMLDKNDSENTSIFKTKVETIIKTLETNTFGPLLLCQILIPLMKKNNYGRIVNISSGMGQLSDMCGGYTAYRFSKTGLNVITRILAYELKDENILVNTMCPGWVKTDMGGPNATRSVEESSGTIIWLATLPEGGPSGEFFRDKKNISW